LWVAERAPDLGSAARQAATAIDTGAARVVLQRLIELSNQPA